MESNKFWSVYIHTNNLNGKKYVGMTSNIEKRFGKNGSGYLHKNKDGKFIQPLFAYAIKKYGWENFSHQIVYKNLSKEEADNLEKTLIKKYDTLNPQKGYNIRKGGSNGKMAEETKNKLKTIMKDKYKGKNNPFYGKKHTKETKDLIAKKAKERKIDISGSKNPMFGKIMTEEERYKRGNGKRGKKLSEEVKRKISERNKEYYKTHVHHALGTHKTKEQKEYMSQKMKGKKLSEEAKRKIGDSHSPYFYRCIETGCEYSSSAEAQRATGISKSSISRAANGQQKQAGGLHWEKRKKS